MKLILMLLLASAGLARADAPDDYAFGIAVTTPGEAAFYRVELPPAVYDGVSRSDLGDLRIFNADGAAVPFAVLTRSASTIPASANAALPLFPLKAGATTTDLSGLTMSLDRTLAGTSLRIATRDGKPIAGDRLMGYVLDASDTKSAIKAIDLMWPDASGSMTRHLKVEGSDDLATWRTIVADAPVIDLEFEGRRLLRNRIDLPPSKLRYFRILWTASDEPFTIRSAVATFADKDVDPPRQWRDSVATPVPQQAGDFAFDLGGKAPIDRVGIDLPEVNSVVPAQLFSRDSPAAPWYPVVSLIAYRLHGAEGDLVPPPIAVGTTTARYWLLRIDPRSGGMRGTPHMRAGGPTQEVVFAARGAAPFSIAYGNATATSARLPITTLVPGYDTASAPPIAQASVDGVAPRSLGGSARLAPPPDTKRYVLWGVLILGVGVLGWMAWRLSAQMKGEGGATLPTAEGASAAGASPGSDRAP